MKIKKTILFLLVATIVMAVFAACDVQFNATINFFVDDTLYYTVEANNETVLTTPPNPTKDGYTFGGWFWDKDIWQERLTVNSLLDAPIAETFSVYALFTPNEEPVVPQQISITFVADGIVYDTVENDGKSIVYFPITPAKSGHTFVGWFFDQGTWQQQLSANTLQTSPVTEDITVYAYFKSLQPTTPTQIAVSFFVGDVVVKTAFSDGKSIVELPSDPEKAKFTFEGWYFDEGVWHNEFVFDTLVNSPQTQNIKVYAYFKPVPVVVTFDFDGETYDTIVTDGKSAIELPSEPRKGGYDFLGWFDADGNQFFANTLVGNPTSDSFSVFAQFSPIADLFVDANATEAGNTFKTIAAALNAATAGQTIFVSFGTYAETLVIDKPVTILGNNYDIDGNGTRREETIVTIGTNIGNEIFNYLGSYSQNVVTITSTDVVLKGLTIDGDNTEIQNIWNQARQQALFGVDAPTPDTSKYYSFEYLKDFYGKDVGVDASVGIFVDAATTKTLTIENNILKNFWQLGIVCDNTTAQTSISCNKISGILPMSTHYQGSYWGVYGDAISIGEGGSGVIFGNTILDAKIAIQLQSNNVPVDLKINSNTLLNCSVGIWLNHTRKQFAVEVKDNSIVFEEGKSFFSPSQNLAIVATNMTQANSKQPLVDSEILIFGNTIKNYNYGIGLGSIDEEANMTIASNQFVNINSSCIGTFATLLGYTMNKPVFVTLADNIYNGLNKFSLQNAETVATGDDIELELAKKFKTDFNAVLELSNQTVSVANKADIEQAIAAHNQLISAVQSHLTEEFSHLTDLLLAITTPVGFEIDGQLFRNGWAVTGSVANDWSAQMIVATGEKVDLAWSSVTLLGLNTSSTGRKTLTATWGNFEIEFDIIVADFVVDTSIEEETAKVKKTIQVGIDNADDGSTLFVAAGIYVEEIEIYKPLTLWGANFDSAGTEHDDSTKTVIWPTRSDFYALNQKVVQVYISSSNVSLKGFTIDGDNPALSSTYGAGTDVSTSIYVYDAFDLTNLLENVVIENNRILNANRYFIYGFSQFKGEVVNRHSIKNNYMKNCFAYPEQYTEGGNDKAFGQAITVLYNFHVDIVGNTIENVRTGIQFEYATTVGKFVIKDNTLTNVRKVGLWLNQDEHSDGSEISNNMVSADRSSGDICIGLLLSSNNKADITSQLTANSFDGFTYGIFSGATTGNIEIIGGSVLNSDVAVYMGGFDGMYEYKKDNYLTIRDVNISVNNAIHVKFESIENSSGTYNESRLYVDGSTVVDTNKIVSKTGNRNYLQILPGSVMYNSVVETNIVTKSWFEGLGTEESPFVVNNQNFTHVGENKNAYYIQTAALVVYHKGNVEVEIPTNYSSTATMSFFDCDGMKLVNNGKLGATITLPSTVEFVNNGTTAAITLSGEGIVFVNNGTTAAVALTGAGVVFTNNGTTAGVTIGSNKDSTAGHGSKVVNHGTINGTLSIYAQDAEVENFGTINVAVSANAISAGTSATNAKITLHEGSVLTGRIVAAASNVTLTNNGTVQGLTTLSGEGVEFFNNGTLAAVTLSGQGVVLNNSTTGIVEGLTTVSGANVTVQNFGLLTNSASYAMQVNAAAENFLLQNYGKIESTHANRSAVYLIKDLANVTIENHIGAEITSNGTNALTTSGAVTGTVVNNGTLKGIIPVNITAPLD